MFETMYASKGVGLAAPQVGLKKRVLVLNPSGDPDQTDQALVLVNPAIVDRSGAPTLFDEGCLSFPGIYAEVERPDRCRVQAKNAAGEPFEGEYDAFVSRIVQHEYDHLEGVLLVDRMSPADKQRHKAALAQLVDDFRRRKAGSGR
jgi:peptide deformylase